MSTAASVLPEINTSAYLPGIQEGEFPSPKVLTNTHFLRSMPNTWGQTEPCREWHSSAVAWLSYALYIKDPTFPTQSLVGCV